MPTCPILIDGAAIACSVVLDASQHRYTGSIVVQDSEREQRWFHGLAITRYPESKDEYLLYCDHDWDTENDSLYSAVDGAFTSATQQFRVAQADWGDELHLARDLDCFRQISESLQSLLGVEWTALHDGVGQSHWDLSTSGGVVTLHREHDIDVSAWGPLALLDRVRRHLQTAA